MSNRITLRSQSQLLDDMRRRMRDAAANIWTDTEVYMVLGDVLMSWIGRVSVPHIYTVAGGWVEGTQDYTLPSYIAGDIVPQQKRFTNSYLYQYADTDPNQWVDMLDYRVTVNTDGGLTLHLGRNPDSGDGRIIWWGQNGRLPLTVPTLTSGITASDTSATVTTSEDLPESGYIKIGNEWISYAGAARGSGQITLSNLGRGVYGTTAATHSTSDSAYIGVAVHRDDLFTQLYDATRAELHAMYITSAAESERTHHERMTMYYRDQATMYWRGYVPARKTQIQIDRRVTGWT